MPAMLSSNETFSMKIFPVGHCREGMTMNFDEFSILRSMDNVRSSLSMRYVVPTGRVIATVSIKVPAGRYIVPAGYIVPTGRTT
ncbi:hypothetical protein Tco_0535221 [Tanacetum coccineum]